MTSSERNSFRLLLVLLAIVGLVGLLIWKFVFPRVVETWEAHITTQDGRVLEVSAEYSNRKQFGHADIFLVGGGSPEYGLTIHGAGPTEIKWRGSVSPVVIDGLGGRIYLVSFGHQGSNDEPAFVYCVWEGDTWRTLRPTEFPAAIAVVNFGTRPPSEGEDVRVALRDRDYLISQRFRRSLTARLWYCIERGVKYWEVRSLTVPEEFVVAFYEREIANAGGS